MSDNSLVALRKSVGPFFSARTLGHDLMAGLVVFLVALPLCLGIALASGAPLFSGIVAGVVGGVLVGALSGSHTSVSGPAAGLTAIVSAQIFELGTFEVFLLAVMLAGVLQILLGVFQTGSLASFVPTSVIKGLLAAIGIILVLKQLPHVLGHDTDPEGEMAFEQPDHENTFSELLAMIDDFHMGAALVGLASIALLVVWSKVKRLDRSRVPAPLVVVLVGLAAQFLLARLGEPWAIGASHLVQVPVAGEVGGAMGLLTLPDFSAWNDPNLYAAAVTIAIVASLETLLNLQAIDKIDPQQRVSPPSRELWAQGVGNVTCGLLGGLPITSVVIRGSVNVYYGAATKLSTIVHGLLLATAVLLLPGLLNRIPLSCLAAILLVTGFKLASPKLMVRMWKAGRDQFIPFIATVIAIVLTDLLIGLGIGMAVALGFILARHSRRTLRRIHEKHLGGDVLHLVLPMQVTFLNQRAVTRALDEIPRDGHVLLDAQQTEYIDPDVLEILKEYRDVIAPARGVHLSMVGFEQAHRIEDDIQFVDHSTRELQEGMTPAQVVEVLRQGNQRFHEGRRLDRDLARQVGATARGQHPLAVVLSCIDSRTPAELVFDTGLGDVFSVRVAGNVLSPKVLGSMEYGTAVAGARLIVVMGHTRCGAVTAAVDLVGTKDAAAATGCQHLDPILIDIQRSVDREAAAQAASLSPERKREFVDDVARRNVLSVVRRIVDESNTIRRLVEEGRIAVVGTLYDIGTGKMDFMLDEAIGRVTETETKAQAEPTLGAA
jgi:MFS superfamily sulfate permease-like transporter